MQRRNFLLSAAPLILPRRVFGANDRLKLAVIGLGNRAKWLLKNEEFPQADFVAFSDCNAPRMDEARQIKPSLERAKTFVEFRTMIEREKPDAVFVETTTHARVWVAMQAMQMGVDVYAEKPMSLTIAEGRAMADAAKKWKRVVQVGTQQRSIPINEWASRRIREGLLGRVHTVVVCNFEAPKVWEPKPAQPIPEGLNWDVWCNQTELRPYHRDLQTRWAMWRDYDGGGQSWGVTGWGTHSLDQVHCALGKDDTGPVEIWPEEPGQEGRVTMRYADGTLLRLVGKKRPEDHSDLGAIFHGENGTLEIKRGLLVGDAELRKGAPPDTIEGPGENAWHIQNFLNAVRTRKAANADAEVGHRSTTVCCLVNICRDLGRRLQWDPVKEQFVNDAEANLHVSRPRRKGYELPALG
ncbi:MAG TPA: Gfo/Idh/MocA family oxidoreductase [Bryobacteraceae bacterium]|nr:Gfo/Idh/MocA family oxidoreductase [Bryobacteraceae bacterium]